MQILRLVMLDRFRSLLLILCILSFPGCQSVDLGTPVFNIGETSDRYHVVQRGDTLYSIAWRYGLDYKDLAGINGISPPYTIYVDQKIKLATTGRNRPKAERPQTDGPPPATTVVKKPPPPPPTKIETASLTNGQIEWRWPVEGEVIEQYSLKGKINKGIDIRGKAGDPVKSAAEGVVVYAGSGLRGYGKLVIVKHSDRYLSAYAHNRAILVKEGDRVASGQVVARIGASGPGTEMLHFEIRRDGKPRNPLEYLPRR